eukprot:8370847-Pyramimonas_sp.AAC.1
MRHLASEIDRLASKSLKKSRMLSRRPNLRTVAVRFTTRQDHGQAHACQDLMVITVRVSGKQADDDLFFSTVSG